MPATTFDRSLRAGDFRLALPQAPRLSFALPPWLPGLGLALFVLLLVIAGTQWRQLPLQRLQIEGRFEHVQPEQVRQALTPHLESGFYSVDVDAIRRDVGTLAWVERARVERVWPAGVRVRVWEREAYARWNQDGLLDTHGTAFTPDAADRPAKLVDALPQLSGTPGNEKLVIDTYRRLSEGLRDTSLALSGLSLDARGEWTAQTRRGVELRLGPGNAVDKLPVLAEALPAALGERLADVAYVDLRYTNGFAIGWTQTAASAAAPGSRAVKREIVSPSQQSHQGGQHG